MRWALFAAAALVVAGCDIENVTRCAGVDLVCPPGLLCHNDACASADAIAACEGAGKPDGADCSVEGAAGFFGFCAHGACVGAGCGDGVRTDPEQCEGADLRGGTCEVLGFYTGTLSCGPTCLYDKSACHERCGDGELNGPELCDGAQLPTASCLDYGFDRGRVECTAACGIGFDACGFLGWRRLASADVTTTAGDGPGRLLVAQTDGQLYTVDTATGLIDPLATWPLGYHAYEVFVVGGVRYASGTYGIDSTVVLAESPTGWQQLTSPTLYGELGTDGTSMYWSEGLVFPSHLYQLTGTTWTQLIELSDTFRDIVQGVGRMLVLHTNGSILAVSGATTTLIVDPGPGLQRIAEAPDGTVWGFTNGASTCTVRRKQGRAMVVEPTPGLGYCADLAIAPDGTPVIAADGGTYVKRASGWWRLEGAMGTMLTHDGVIYGFAHDVFALSPERWEGTLRPSDVLAAAPTAAGGWLLGTRDGVVRYDGTTFSAPVATCGADPACWYTCEASPGVAFAAPTDPDSVKLAGPSGTTTVHILQQLAIPPGQILIERASCNGADDVWMSIGEPFGNDHVVRMHAGVAEDLASDVAIVDIAALPGGDALVLAASTDPLAPGSRIDHYVPGSAPVTIYEDPRSLTAVWGCASDRWAAAGPGDVLVQEPGVPLADEPLAEFDRIKTLATASCAPGMPLVAIGPDRVHVRTATGWAPVRVTLPPQTNGVAGGAVGTDGVVVFSLAWLSHLVEAP